MAAAAGWLGRGGWKGSAGMTRRHYQVGMFLLLALSSGTASALQNFTGRVGQIEATYMPTRIQFTLSEGNTSCPAGKTLSWSNASQDNNKAVYAALVSAFVSGKQVRFYIDDNDQSCVGRFIYLVE